MTEKPILICMRLANMKRVHPAMTTDRECSMCHHVVGIYPSGQRILAAMEIPIVCEVCKPDAVIQILAPGAEAERLQSVRRH